MATLINRFKVHDQLIKMINEAEEQLVMISPYIKLHPEYKKALEKRLKDHTLRIIVVFGKNSDNISKSLSLEDFDFFSQFPNIQIRYCERLHAKIFANDFYSLVTSMNLHKFSAEENIEVGILCENTLFDDIKDIAHALTNNIFGKDSLDAQVYDFTSQIIEKYSPKVYFDKIPEYEKGILSKTYIGSAVKVSPDRFMSIASNKRQTGYCIRTGKPIPFNSKRPYSDSAFESWSKYKNQEFAEKYCHFSGEASNGDTCFKRPILSKNWKAAKDVWKL